MNMKIGKPEDRLPAAPVANKGRATAADGQQGQPTAPVNTASGAAPAEPSTTVALSSQATQLLSGDSAVSGDFDANKVERIAQAITDGKFEINAPAIADKLLANAREILSTTHH